MIAIRRNRRVHGGDSRFLNAARQRVLSNGPKPVKDAEGGFEQENEMGRDVRPVWILQNLDTGTELAFSAEHLAMHAAEKMVGNRAVAALGDTLAYGPGDGTTSVLIRRMTRDQAATFFPEVSLPIDE